MTVLAWCRVGAAGEWNGDPTANPATGAGGIDLSVITQIMGPIVSISGGGQETFNFGNAAFVGAVPAGYTSGWPGTGAGGHTAFDPTKLVGSGTLSNNNRTFTQGGFGPTFCQILDADLVSTGAYYFEMTYVSRGAITDFFGGGIGRQYPGIDYNSFSNPTTPGKYGAGLSATAGGIVLVSTYPNFPPDPFHTTFGALGNVLISQPPTESFTYQPGVTVCWAINFGFTPPSGNQITGIADLWYSPTTTFVDLRSSSNRRLFVGVDGSSTFLGDDGSLPIGATPPIFLTRSPGAGADTWAHNDGSGGSFTIAEPPALQAYTGSIPPCGPYAIDGNVPPNTPQGADPQIMLSVSDDGGRTFSLLQKWRSLGKIGEYKKRLRWLKMGQFRQRQIRLEITDPVRRNIIGIYQDVVEGLDW